MRKLWYFKVSVFIVAIGAALLAMNEAHRHPVLTTDSIIYIDTARHIAASQGPSTSILKVTDSISPTPQTQWPPLYSIKMASLIKFGVDPIFAGRIVSAIAFGLTVILIGMWSRKLAGPYAGFAAAALVAALPALSSTSAAVWADSLYMLIVTAMVWLGSSLIQQPKRRLAWFTFGCLIGIAILTKYLGLLLLGILAVTILLSLRRDRNLLAGASRLGLALLGTAIFVIPMLLYSTLNDRPIGGAERTLSAQPLTQTIRDAWSTVSSDLTVNALWIGIVIITGTSLLTMLRRAYRPRLQPLVLPALAFVVYILGLIAARFLIDTDDIYTRFAMPVYPLAILVMTSVIAFASSSLRISFTSALMGAIAVIALVWSIKTYDFNAPAYAPEPSARTQAVAATTTDRDLIIGTASREYNLFLGRTVIHLSDDTTAAKLTPELLQTLRDRWHDRFDRILLVISPSSSTEDYGPFVAMAANGQSLPGLTLLEQTPTLVSYSVN